MLSEEKTIVLLLHAAQPRTISFLIAPRTRLGVSCSASSFIADVAEYLAGFDADEDEKEDEEGAEPEVESMAYPRTANRFEPNV